MSQTSLDKHCTSQSHIPWAYFGWGIDMEGTADKCGR